MKILTIHWFFSKEQKNLKKILIYPIQQVTASCKGFQIQQLPVEFIAKHAPLLTKVAMAVVQKTKIKREKASGAAK